MLAAIILLIFGFIIGWIVGSGIQQRFQWPWHK